MLPENTFTELIDKLIYVLYDKDQPLRVKFPYFLKEYMGMEFSSQETWILLGKVVDTGFFEQWFDEGGPVITDIIYLSDKGIELVYSHGTYSKYIVEINSKQQKQQKETEELKRIEKKGKIFSNWNSITSVFYGAIGIIVTILVTLQQCRSNHLDNKIQEQTVKMDSILRAIENLQKQR